MVVDMGRGNRHDKNIEPGVGVCDVWKMLLPSHCSKQGDRFFVVRRNPNGMDLGINHPNNHHSLCRNVCRYARRTFHKNKENKNMKIAIVQHIIRWNELDSNLHHLTSLMNQQPGADLYVLAETFATGFLAEGSSVQAVVEAPQIFCWMQQQARRLNAAIAGSVATVDDRGFLRNRFFFVRPDGSFDYYDKRHLFGYAGETDEYVAGERRVVTQWRGVRFLLQVCYDLRFPVFSRNRGDYDAIIYVANWPARRCEVWQTLLKARALENQCFVAGVNIVGRDKECEYMGDSVVVNAYGRVIASCSSGMVETAMAELDMEELQRFRKKFPVLEDADEFKTNGL